MSLGPMRPLLIFTRIIGLSPTGGPPDFKSRIAKLPLVLSVLTVAYAAWTIPQEVLKIIGDYSYRKSHFGSILHINVMAVVLIGHLGLTLGTFRKTKYLPKVLQDCNNIPGPQSDCWATTLYTFEVLCMTTVGVGLRYLCSLVGNEVLNSVSDPVVGLLVLATADRILFVHLVRHIGTSFNSINARLTVMQKVVSSRESYTAKQDLHAIKNHTSLFHTELCRLMDAHGDACDVLDRLTLTQEIQLLAILIVEFVLTVVYLYVVCFTVYFKLFQMAYIISFGSGFILWLFLTQFIAVVSCRSTTRKGNQTLEIIYDMINCGKFTDVETQQLTLFCMQIGHQEVAVVPHGLFNMDISLLKSFITTVLMYVVILVQFGNPGI